MDTDNFPPNFMKLNREQREKLRREGTLLLPREALKERQKGSFGFAQMHLLCWIDHYCHLSDDGLCHLTNAQLAKEQQCGSIQVSKHISALRKRNFLDVKYDAHNGRSMLVKWPSGNCYK